MNAIQEKCRPKHQVLVLKCYPRTIKGAVDVKPNSSELSYLLFYATSRRSKIQKVGSFLEKKTASDVWRLRIGNVQVTLQILEALIEKDPKDLPLYAPSVLKILELVLKSNDITMVESSLPTFEAFCAHHDGSSLSADQSYLRMYENIVRQYAALASTRSSPGKTPSSRPIAARWRSAGLEAIKSVASSEALSSISGRQYEVLVPMILENLWTDNEDFLEVLLQRVQLDEKVDTEKLMRRRTSIATVRTAETTGDTNPIALSGTAMDVDKLAEEDIGVLAMTCLKQIFIAPVRTQIRSATIALLKFIEDRVSQHETVVKTQAKTGKDEGWAVKMYEIVARWVAVQDRYTILVTTLDTMATFPLTLQTLPQHVALAAMIDALLRSDINLIGLSVMDVLLGLMHHIKRLVQMPGDPAPRSGSVPDQQEGATGRAATTQRKELLHRLQNCIGNLATHVYYADQISDMIQTILQRLRPARSSSTASFSPLGEKTDEQHGPTGGDGHHGDSMFSLTITKTAALKAIRSILLVANPRTKLAGNLGLSRNKVPMHVWEGTHWLLRDADGQVRKAYADALTTWLDRETTPKDLKARDEQNVGQKNQRYTTRELQANTPTRRAVSSASNREKATKAPKSFFLQLLHLAIYDNALQFTDYETDIVLLHVILAKLVFNLGVNAVQYGLPMVFQLQEAIMEVDAPQAKVRLGSLVHGYFWILTEKFDFDSSAVGRAVQNEIIRRRSKQFWVEGVHVPAPLVELVGTPGTTRPQPRMAENEIEDEALLPFDDRMSLVENICTGYAESSLSPPQSPAASPSRNFTYPILSQGSGGVSSTMDSRREVPAKIREQMLTDWSRDAAMIAVQAASKSASLSGGSRTATTTTNRNRLGSNGLANGNAHTHDGKGSPFGSQQNLRPQSQPAPGGLAPRPRRTSVRSGISASPGSPSGRGGGGFVTSVDQLKMVLTGQLQPPESAGDDSSDDSMVSYDMTPSELSFNPPAADANQGGVKRSVSRERRSGAGEVLGPLTSHPPHDATPIMEVEEEEEEEEKEKEEQREEQEQGEGEDSDIPPVPPLPADWRENSVSQTPDQGRPKTANITKLDTKSRAGEVSETPSMDLQSLLQGINSRAGEHSIGSVTRPPY